MRNLVTLKDYDPNDIEEIFDISDKIEDLGLPLRDRVFVLFFPESSIRTRITFETGIQKLGGRTILFPSSALDKDEAMEDVLGYLENWADCIIVRHKSHDLIKEMARYSHIPIINAMSQENHPCEIISDFYAFRELERNLEHERCLYIGSSGNIGNTYKELADIYGIDFVQCCPRGYEIENCSVIYDLPAAVENRTIILTDSLGGTLQKDFSGYLLKEEHMELADPDVLINPCPPFHRNVEVEDTLLRSDKFVGYQFKKSLMNIQMAILIYSLQS